MQQMQNMAVDVEVNLKIRERRLKAEKGDELDIFVKKEEELNQMCTIEVEFLEHHNRSVLQKESNDIHEQTCHKKDDIFIPPYMMEQSPDIMYEYNSFSYFNGLPKYDQYDDDCEPNYQIGLANELHLIFSQSTVQDQLREHNDQNAHLSYEEKEENAECVDFSEGTLPFCFESFQFIKENYHAINKKVSARVNIDRLEDDQIIVQNVLPLILQTQRAIEYQIEEDLEAAAYYQMIQVDPLPLCFQPSELFEEEEEEQPAQISQVLFEPDCKL